MHNIKISMNYFGATLWLLSFLTKLGVRGRPHVQLRPGGLTRSRRDPASLAFVVTAYAALLLLLRSLRRFERAPAARGQGQGLC